MRPPWDEVYGSNRFVDYPSRSNGSLRRDLERERDAHILIEDRGAVQNDSVIAQSLAVIRGKHDD
jgi:hypothetical protein